MYKRLSSQRVQENTWDENRRDISVNFEDGSLNGSQGRTHVKLFCAKTHHIKDYTSIQTIATTELRINRSIGMGYLLSGVVKHSPFPHVSFICRKGLIGISPLRLSGVCMPFHHLRQDLWA